MSPLYSSCLFLELPSALQLEVYYLLSEKSFLSLNPSPKIGTGSMQWKVTLLPNQMKEKPEVLPHLSAWALIHLGHTHMFQGVFRFVPWTKEMLASILSDLLASDLSNLHLSKRPVSLFDTMQSYFSLPLDSQEISDPSICQHPL